MHSMVNGHVGRRRGHRPRSLGWCWTGRVGWRWVLLGQVGDTRGIVGIWHPLCSVLRWSGVWMFVLPSPPGCTCGCREGPICVSFCFCLCTLWRLLMPRCPACGVWAPVWLFASFLLFFGMPLSSNLPFCFSLACRKCSLRWCGLQPLCTCSRFVRYMRMPLLGLIGWCWQGPQSAWTCHHGIWYGILVRFLCLVWFLCSVLFLQCNPVPSAWEICTPCLCPFMCPFCVWLESGKCSLTCCVVRPGHVV